MKPASREVERERALRRGDAVHLLEQHPSAPVEQPARRHRPQRRGHRPRHPTAVRLGLGQPHPGLPPTPAQERRERAVHQHHLRARRARGPARRSAVQRRPAEKRPVGIRRVGRREHGDLRLLRSLAQRAQQVEHRRQRELRRAHAGDEVAAAHPAAVLERPEDLVHGREAARESLGLRHLAGDQAVAREQLLGGGRGPLGRPHRGGRALLHQRPAPLGRGRQRCAGSGRRARPCRCGGSLARPAARCTPAAPGRCRSSPGPSRPGPRAPPASRRGKPPPAASWSGEKKLAPFVRSTSRTARARSDERLDVEARPGRTEQPRQVVGQVERDAAVALADGLDAHPGHLAGSDQRVEVARRVALHARREDLALQHRGRQGAALQPLDHVEHRVEPRARPGDAVPVGEETPEDARLDRLDRVPAPGRATGVARWPARPRRTTRAACRRDGTRPRPGARAGPAPPAPARPARPGSPRRAATSSVVNGAWVRA